MTVNLDFFKKKHAVDLTACLLILVLPFSMALPNFVLGLGILIALIQSKKKGYTFKWKTSYFILILLFTYLILKSTILGTTLLDLKIYVRFILTILVLFLYLKTKNTKLIELTFLSTVILSILISMIKIALYYYEYKSLPFANGMMVNKLLLFERPYFGFLIVMGLILLVKLFKTEQGYRIILSVCATLMLIFVFFISARLSLATLFVLILIYLFKYLKIKKTKKAMALLFFMISIIVISQFNENLMERINMKGDFENSISNFKRSEPRVVIWNCAKQMSKDDFNVIFGKESYTKIKGFFHNCYGESIKDDFQKRAYFQESGFNSHNSFIEFYLIGGVISLALFLSFFLISLTEANNFVSLAIIISLLFFCFFENMLQRQNGCYIFAVALFFALRETREHECKRI